MIRKKFQQFLFSVALLTFVGMGAVAVAQTPKIQALEDVRQLSLLSVDNSNPALAFSPDGTQLFVVWDGMVEGNRRILMREQIAGEWLKTVIVDANPAGENKFPSIAVDGSGTPHISWVSTVGDKRRPMYARRLARFPNTWYQQAIPFPSDSTVTGNCDFVNLQLDPTDRPWIVWQYGFGSIISVACSHYDASGEFSSVELTPGTTNHNLYPELFFLPEPTVYWYIAQSDQFYLIGSRLDAKTGQWRVALPENFENVPGDPLPDLFRTSRGPLAAIWYDRQQQGGDLGSDRIFLGVQSKETRGRGEVIDEQPGAGNHSVAATAPYDTFITAWISETYENGAAVFLGVGNSPETVDSIKVSGDVPGIGSNPKVAGSANRAAVAWEEKAGTGGSLSEIVIRIANLQQ